MGSFFTKLPFVILAYPRTGSYLLVDLLNQFDDITCYGEIFKPRRHELPESIIDEIGFSIEQRDEEPLRFIKRLLEIDSEKLIGFKIFPGHNKKVNEWYKSRDDVPKIALIRSPLEVYVSLLRAKTTGVWINRGKSAEEASAPSPKLLFAKDDFEKEIGYICNYIKNAKNLAANKPLSTRIVEYENLTKHDTIFGLAAFLGSKCQPEKLVYRLRKQTVEKYHELFVNFDEFQDHVAKFHPELHFPRESV